MRGVTLIGRGWGKRKLCVIKIRWLSYFCKVLFSYYVFFYLIKKMLPRFLSRSTITARQFSFICKIYTVFACLCLFTNQREFWRAWISVECALTIKTKHKTFRLWDEFVKNRELKSVNSSTNVKSREGRFLRWNMPSWLTTGRHFVWGTVLYWDKLYPVSDYICLKADECIH